MTEEEAKKKWCPMAKVMNINGGGGGNRWDGAASNKNKDAIGPVGATCVASDCMAWRWYDHVKFDASGTSQGRPDDCPGYCGLAGKPKS